MLNSDHLLERQLWIRRPFQLVLTLHASIEDQLKVQALMSLWIEEIEAGGEDALEAIMRSICREAADRGLTPEILEELLADES